MLKKKFHHAIQAATADRLRSALHLLLRPHAEPVFGAAKTVEHEVAALNALKTLGYIGHAADEFDLVERLRATKSGSIAKTPEGALIRFVEELIPAEKKDKINKRLIEAGKADMSVAGFIKAMLGKIGKKAFDEVGEQAGKTVGDHIAKVFAGGWKQLESIVKNLELRLIATANKCFCQG